MLITRCDRIRIPVFFHRFRYYLLSPEYLTDLPICLVVISFFYTLPQLPLAGLEERRLQKWIPGSRDDLGRCHEHHSGTRGRLHDSPRIGYTREVWMTMSGDAMLLPAWCEHPISILLTHGAPSLNPHPSRSEVGLGGIHGLLRQQ